MRQLCSRYRRLLLILAVALLLPTACKGEPGKALDDGPHGRLEELDPDDQLVVFWHGLKGADEDLLVEMIDDFNATNQWGITVVGEYLGDLPAIYDKVIAGLPTDRLPSLIMADASLAATYAVKNIAVPIEPFLQSEKWGFSQAEMDDFIPGALTSEGLPQFGNQLFSLPFCRSLQVLYYNVDWLKELGLDAPPQTWDEFREMACAASKPEEALFGFELGMDSSIFASLLETQDVPLFSSQTSAYTLGGNDGQEALQFLQDLIIDGCAQWETEKGVLTDLSAGTILFAIDSTAELPNYQRAVADGANFAWAVSSLPHTAKEALVSVHGPSTVIARNTPEEQLGAWLFTKWLADPEQQARWSRHKACLPTRRSTLEAIKTYIEANAEYRLALPLLDEEWITEPNVAGYAVCSVEIGRMLYAVTAGESVDKWLNDTLSICNQTLVNEKD